MAIQNNFRKPYRPIQKQREHKINEEITYPEVRITGDKVESRIVTIAEALRISKEMEVDLVEISPNAVPPVCKLIEYGKLMYEKKQKDKDQKKKQEQSELKELRFTPTTDDHDFLFKTNHAIHWLKNGDKVKAVVVYKGRMIKYKEAGEILLLKLAEALQDYGKVEQLPKLEGFKMTLLIVPKKK
jgi:translation initiation factor IF-3